MQYLNILISFLLIFSDYTRVFNIPSYFNRYLLVFTILITFLLKATLKENIKRIFLFMIAFVFYLLTGIKIIIYLIVYYELSKKIFIKKILKIHIIISLIFFIVIVTLGNLNIYQNIIFKGKMYNGIKYIRSTLGFWSPNTWGIYWFQIFSGLLMITKKKKMVLVLGSYLTYIFYIKTISRTSVLIIFIYLFIYLLNICFKEKIVKYMKLIKWFPLALTLISLFLSFSFNKNYHLIDKILTGRLYLSNLAIKIYGISFFSKKILHIPIDNSYIFYFISNGIIVLVIVNIIYYKILQEILRKKINYIYIPYIISFFIYGLSENVLTNYQGINLLNILFYINYKKNRKKSEDDIKNKK